MTPFIPNIDYSDTLETYVLGVCLLEPDAILKTSMLNRDMFYFEAHAIVYGVLTEMQRKKIPIDLITVTYYIDQCGLVLPGYERHLTAWYLSKLTNDVIHSAHLHHWCMCLKEMWQKRQIARLDIKSVDDLKKAQVVITRNTSKIKHYRFLLTYLDKGYIKTRINLYGAKTITGKCSYKFGVSTSLLVFLMSAIEPKYTWTCAGKHDELMTNENCKTRLNENALFNGINWIDKTTKLPVAWL